MSLGSRKQENPGVGMEGGGVKKAKQVQLEDCDDAFPTRVWNVRPLLPPLVFLSHGEEQPSFVWAPEFVNAARTTDSRFNPRAGQGSQDMKAPRGESSYSFADYGRDVSGGMVKRFRGQYFQTVDFNPAMLVLLACTDHSFLVFGFYDKQLKSNFETLLLMFHNAGIRHDTSDANIKVKTFCCSEVLARDQDDWACFGSGLFVVEIKQGGDGYWATFCPFPIEVQKCPEEQGLLAIWHKKS